MPRYMVIVTRDLTESAQIEVFADSPEEADEIALVIAAEDKRIKWEEDEGNCHEPYIGDPGNAQELH